MTVQIIFSRGLSLSEISFKGTRNRTYDDSQGSDLASAVVWKVKNERPEQKKTFRLLTAALSENDLEGKGGGRMVDPLRSTPPPPLHRQR